MPIYAYRCGACGAECEQFVRGDDAPPVCPDCGSADLQRLLSRLARPGKTGKMIEGARRQAAKEGHFSNYAKSERPKTR
ncbi:FmdB family zinc ribbon protein [Rhodovulum euryhalinum]|uniref:Putative FmdB family regulatory protein n=1 Tax=Rhodovulum euryhalinum TaxID=35805 RepID=A0A4R2KJ26_9RHOB|nr:zinc ribbon domain-containing protein [Rhodovulum euryhalinum]TCO72417.1 putative FmdB family regulatory protein [Rhodovulum euryhalinum]